jgi:hypothetical protein
MPIDPSIISNAFANISMPDANALMQQRVQGAQNIYQIETGRQEQAKADAKAQEDAAVKALLPAYAHALKTGDLRGALKLAPPQYQDSLVPYMEALEGKPREEIEAALTGSLVTSDVGRAFLENQSRVATLGVQQGQLDVARQDLVLRRQKQALDARGDGNWEWKEGTDANGNPAFAWVNPRTREVVMADLTGAVAPAPGAIPAPDVVTPRQPAPGMPEVPPPPAGAVQPPAGAVQPPAFRPKPKEGTEKGLNEGEGKSYNFAIRMIDSDAVANELEKEGVLTTDAVTDAVVGAIRALPTVAGGNLSEQIQNALNVVSPSLSPEEQRLAVAQLDFITAVLRSESGAEIKTSEFPAEYRKYFPVEGDENNPKLLADKKRRRQNAIEGMKTRAGKSGRSQIEAYFAGEGTEAPAPAPAAPGTSLDGFTFRGVKSKGQ